MTHISVCQGRSLLRDAVSTKLTAGLPEASRLRLKALVSRRRRLHPYEDLIRQGHPAHECHYFVMEGVLCRYKLLSGDRRAVLAYLVPGDFCGPSPDFFGPMDHAIASLTEASIAQVPRQLLQECLSSDPDLARALSGALIAEGAIQRQWLANMSCPADKRLAHLLCELRARLAPVGLADEGGFLLPLTQHELAEALGISTVHVNRTLQHLKDLGVMRIMDHRIMIPDLGMLESFAEFDPAYLGFTGPVPCETRPVTAVG